MVLIAHEFVFKALKKNKYKFVIKKEFFFDNVFR